MRIETWLVVLAVLGAGGARADSPTPSPSPADPQTIGTVVGGGGPEGGGVSMRTPPERVPDTAPRAISVPDVWDPNRDAKDSGPWKGVRILTIAQGQARVSLPSGERVLRPGDVVGSDVVKSVDAQRIVLTRGATAQRPDGDALVVISVDAQGRSRVRVYSAANPTAGRRPNP
jgi:hypothetical protein